MLIRKLSIWSGKLHSVDLPINADQLRRWQNGEMVQDVFPDLEPWQREYLINGMTQDELVDAFGKADEDTWKMINGGKID